LGCVNIFEFVVRIGLSLVIVDIQFVVKVIPMGVVIAAEFVCFLKGLDLKSRIGPLQISLVYKPSTSEF
jgi:hypothetical protein